MTECQELVCWKCGSPLGDLPLPLSRFAECRHCRAPLHVCPMCRFFDPKASRHCREPMAEEVCDPGQANSCGWFQVRPGAHPGRKPDPRAARAALEALFGDTPGEGRPDEGAPPSPE